ncbi:hypothetical protein B0T10DRAFT_68738 [Thelonectria olida]|uniref:Uncharacterized protein n=1 Tax=Thelonectria olida TaxID=1576542 RepID=A0A9P9ANK1_9HYPO|nr:hypothetical protein B0T10DRAFT_68738 [Thelonectria olida]
MQGSVDFETLFLFCSLAASCMPFMKSVSLLLCSAVHCIISPAALLRWMRWDHHGIRQQLTFLFFFPCFLFSLPSLLPLLTDQYMYVASLSLSPPPFVTLTLISQTRSLVKDHMGRHGTWSNRHLGALPATILQGPDLTREERAE